MLDGVGNQLGYGKRDVVGQRGQAPMTQMGCRDPPHLPDAELGRKKVHFEARRGGVIWG